MKAHSALLALLAVSVLIPAIAAEGIDPGNPLSVKSIRAELLIRGAGTISGPIGASDTLTLKILVPQSSENQVVEEISEAANYGGSGYVPASHEIDGFGNRYAVFTFNSLREREFSYDIKATISTKTYPGLADHNVSEGFAEEYLEFIRPTAHAESNDATIRTIASSIMPTDSELESIASAAEWANNYVSYDASYWGQSLSARQVLEARRGVCVEYTNLTAALLKAKGIPVRVVSGLVYSSRDWNNHAWVEAYVPGRGWIGVDSTYGEAGLLDGTHIEMGKADDRDNFSDQKYVYTGSFEVELKDDRKVNVLSVENFSGLAEVIPESFPDKNLYAESFQRDLNKGQKFDLNALIQSKLGQKAVLPAQLALHESFALSKPNRLLVLEPFGKREVSWQAIAPDANADYAYGYRVETMGASFEGVIPVLQPKRNGFPAGGAQIIVEESIPTITAEEALELKMKLFNAGKEAVDANIVVYGSDSSLLLAGTETIPALESRQLSYRIPKAFSQEFVLLKITARGFNYEEKINLSRGTSETISGGQANPGNEANQEAAQAREEIRKTAQKAEEWFAGLVKQDLLIPAGGIIILLMLLWGLRRSFHSSRL